MPPPSLLTVSLCRHVDEKNAAALLAHARQCMLVDDVETSAINTNVQLQMSLLIGEHGAA